MSEEDGRETQPTDEIVEALQGMVNAIILAKRRYPILLAVAKELDALSEVVKARSRKDAPIRNDAILQLLRDSFDMLVIDLASKRRILLTS